VASAFSWVRDQPDVEGASESSLYFFELTPWLASQGRLQHLAACCKAGLRCAASGALTQLQVPSRNSPHAGSPSVTLCVTCVMYVLPLSDGQRCMRHVRAARVQCPALPVASPYRHSSHNTSIGTAFLQKAPTSAGYHHSVTEPSLTAEAGPTSCPIVVYRWSSGLAECTCSLCLGRSMCMHDAHA
jgi:hypothetical protein